MATNEDVEGHIDAVYDTLIALEAVIPDSPEKTAHHEALLAARNAAVEHFGLNIGARSGGGSKTPPDPNEVP